MTIVTDLRCLDYSAPGHPESPERIRASVEKLRSQAVLQLDWAEPLAVEEKTILRAHAAKHLQRLNDPWPFDSDTPAYPHIAEHAGLSVGGAIQAMEKSLAGQPAFSLFRPPGHHACRHRAMGFCYLNQIAIAVLEARARGIERVAVFDFDVHHGNGTEEILLDEPGCAFISVHQFPLYPGTGLTNRGTNCFNFPVEIVASREEYRTALVKALDQLERLEPDLIAVSAGFDAFHADPLAYGRLEMEDFRWLGQSLQRFHKPVFSVLEGGYSRELPDLILAYLEGLQPENRAVAVSEAERKP